MGSQKPCPGCGEVDERRKAAEVCYTCKMKLKSYPGLKRELERINENKIYFRIGRQPHWNRYFSVNYVGWDNRNITSELREAIFNVCMAGSVQGEGNKTYDLPHIMKDANTYQSGGEIARAATQDFFDSIQNLMGVVQRAVNLSYEAGQKDGARFLVDIAEGKKSVQDYEDRMVK